MKVLIDTSVWVAALMETHSDNKRAVPWVERVKQQTITAVISAHTLAEVYSGLTRIPTHPMISPAKAYQLIEANMIGKVEIVALTVDDYTDLIRHLAQTGIAGGAVYDGVIACAAAKAQVDHIVTFNARDFRRVYPALAASVIIP